MPLDKSTISVGMRVQDSTGNVGTVAWVGRIEKKDRPPNNDPATYTAVEFDYPSELHRTDGVLKESGKRYCQCPPHTVEFLKPRYLEAERNDAAVEYLRSHFEEEAIGHLTDALLIKFCVARKYEMSAVIEMLEGHLEWAGKATPSPTESFPEEQTGAYPFVMSSGLARDGSIVTFERPGNGGAYSSGELLSRFEIATVIRMHMTCLEMGKSRIAAEDKAEVMRLSSAGRTPQSARIRNVTAIFDIANLRVTDKSSVLDFAKTAGRIGQDNYPEHLGRAFIVNAPGIFTGIWRIVKFFLDERTKSKVHVLGPGEHLEVLERYMDRSMIPDFLGGEDTAWKRCGGRIGSEDVTRRRPSLEPLRLDHVTQDELLAAVSDYPNEPTVPLTAARSEVSFGESERDEWLSPRTSISLGARRSSPQKDNSVGPAPPTTRPSLPPNFPPLDQPQARNSPPVSAQQAFPAQAVPQALLSKEIADQLTQAMQASSKTCGVEAVKTLARAVESQGRAQLDGAKLIAGAIRTFTHVLLAVAVIAAAVVVALRP